MTHDVLCANELTLLFLVVSLGEIPNEEWDSIIQSFSEAGQIWSKDNLGQDMKKLHLHQWVYRIGGLGVLIPYSLAFNIHLDAFFNLLFAFRIYYLYLVLFAIVSSEHDVHE